MLTYQRLREVLSYNPETGSFTRVGFHERDFVRNPNCGFDTNGYLSISIDGQTYRAHRLAWLYMTGEEPPPVIDHADGEKSNNRWVNLREATATQNKANSKAYAKASALPKGVTQRSKNKFRARVRSHGKLHSLGSYTTPEEAHAAYVTAATQLFGEFARAS